MTDAKGNGGPGGVHQYMKGLEQTIEQARYWWSRANTAIEETRQLRADLQTQIQQLSKNSGFRQRYASTTFTKILHAAVADTNADMGNIQLLDPEANQLQICAHVGFRRPFLDFFNAVHAGQAACGTALSTAHRVVVPEVLDSPIFMDGQCIEVLLDAKVRAVQSTPLIGPSGCLLGILSTHYETPRIPSRKDLRTIDYFAACAATLADWLISDNRSSIGTPLSFPPFGSPLIAPSIAR
jgi:hypothetical protein